jgi:hypothetical protein
VRRRALLLAGLAVLAHAGAPTAASAQGDATDAQLAVIDTYVAHRVAVATGHGVAEAEAALLDAREALDAALARRERVASARVCAEVDARLAEIEARLAEVGRTCGPIPDTTPARARRDALVDVRAALASGVFRGR